MSSIGSHNAAIEPSLEEVQVPVDNPSIPAPEHTEQPMSVRVRPQTEKGREYEKELVSKQLKAEYTKIQRQCNLFTKLLLSNDVDMVHTESTNLDKRLSEAEDLHNRLLELLTDDEQINQLSRHEIIDNQVFNIKQHTCSWLKSQDVGSRSSRSRSRHSKSRASSRHSGQSRHAASV